MKKYHLQAIALHQIVTEINTLIYFFLLDQMFSSRPQYNFEGNSSLNGFVHTHTHTHTHTHIHTHTHTHTQSSKLSYKIKLTKHFNAETTIMTMP